MSAPELHLASWPGDGPPALLVHGMGATTHWWDQAAPRLAGALRPVALDLSGHGESGWRADGAYDERAFAEDVESARGRLGWERFALVGHSLGARVAIEYALAHPRRLSALVLIDFLTDSRLGGRTLSQPYYDSEEAALARFRLQPAGTALGPAELRALGRHSLKQTPRGWTWKFDWRCLRQTFEPVWPALPRLKARTLVVRGALSALMDQAALERVAGAIPGARAASVPGAYHHVPLDAPAALADVLTDFLQ